MYQERIGQFVITYKSREFNPVRVVYISGTSDMEIHARVILLDRNKPGISLRTGLLFVYNDGTKHLIWDI